MNFSKKKTRESLLKSLFLHTHLGEKTFLPTWPGFHASPPFPRWRGEGRGSPPSTMLPISFLPLPFSTFSIFEFAKTRKSFTRTLFFWGYFLEKPETFFYFGNLT